MILDLKKSLMLSWASWEMRWIRNSFFTRYTLSYMKGVKSYLNNNSTESISYAFWAFGIFDSKWSFQTTEIIEAIILATPYWFIMLSLTTNPMMGGSGGHRQEISQWNLFSWLSVWSTLVLGWLLYLCREQLFSSVHDHFQTGHDDFPNKPMEYGGSGQGHIEHRSWTLPKSQIRWWTVIQYDWIFVGHRKPSQFHLTSWGTCVRP